MGNIKPKEFKKHPEVDSKENSKNPEEPNRLTLFVPENFDIDEILRRSPPNFRYKREHFIYLVHLLYDIPLRNKDLDMDYVPLYSKILQSKIRNYKNCLDYLEAQGVIKVDKQYIKSKKSRGYKFMSSYNSNPKGIFITDKKFIKKILKFNKIDNNVIVENDIDKLEYLTKWYDSRLEVDYISAKQYLEELYNKEKKKYFLTEENAKRKYNLRLLVLIKLKRQEFLSVVDSTAGRLHTVLTQLKGDLRQFVRYGGNPLVAVDITNSQPYLSSVLLNPKLFTNNHMLSVLKLYNQSLDGQNLFLKIEKYASSKSVMQYLDWVKSGRLYEEFGLILEKEGLIKGIEFGDKPIRKQAKEILFSAFFSPNQAIGYNVAIKLFKQYFPDVYNIFSLVKSKSHRTLACALQNIEAKLVLRKACFILSEKYPDIPIFTLHDSIITTVGNEKIVHSVMFDVLLENVGIEPHLKIERWEKVA